EGGEELVVAHRAGNLGRPPARLEGTEGGGGEAGEPLGEWQLPVHTVEALRVGRVVADDPVEVVGAEAVEVGGEGVDLSAQAQAVGLGHGPPVLPLAGGQVRVEVPQTEPLGGEAAVEKGKPG